jgi:hypothetical protein
MANEKVKPTEREVRLAKVVSGLFLGVDALIRDREKISEVLSEICEHIDESTEAAMVELEGLNRDLREAMPELFSVVEEPADCDAEVTEAPKPAWEPKEGDWVKVTKPETRKIEGRPFYVDSMDSYDGKVFQVYRVCNRRRVCDFGGDSWDFAFEWLSPAEAPEPQPEAPEPEKDQYFAFGSKVKILHPECLGRTGTVALESCPVRNCLFVWVDSEDPVLRVGAIPVHKRYLAPAEAPQKPVKIQVTAHHIGKQVLVTHRQGDFISSFVRILKGITIRNNRPDIVEYNVGRSPTDCFHDILYINPNDPDSEYQIEPLDD